MDGSMIYHTKGEQKYYYFLPRSVLSMTGYGIFG